MANQQENTNIVDSFGEASLALREYSDLYYKDTHIQIPIRTGFDISVPLEEKLSGMFERTEDYKDGGICRIGKRIDRLSGRSIHASGFISGIGRSQFNDLFLEPEMFNEILKGVYESIPSLPLAKRTELENLLKQVIKVVKAAENDKLNLKVDYVRDINEVNRGSPANNHYHYSDHHLIHLNDNIGNSSFSFLCTYNDIKKFDFDIRSNYSPDKDRYSSRKIEDTRVIKKTGWVFLEPKPYAVLSETPSFVGEDGIYLYVQNKAHAERAIIDFKNSLLREHIPSCKDAPIICRIEELLSEGYISFVQRLREDNKKVTDLQGKEF